MSDPLWIWMFCVGPAQNFRRIATCDSVFVADPKHVDFPSCPHHVCENGVLYVPVMNPPDDPSCRQMYVKLPASEWAWIWPLLMDEPLETPKSL